MDNQQDASATNLDGMGVRILKLRFGRRELHRCGYYRTLDFHTVRPHGIEEDSLNRALVQGDLVIHLD